MSDFRRRLSDAVPTPPPSTGQADAARRHAHRARQRRTAGIAVGCAAVLVAVAVPFGLGSRGSGGSVPTAGFGSDVTCAGTVEKTRPLADLPQPAADTPRDAVEAWAGPDVRGVVIDGDHRARLVRPDGTIRAVVRIGSVRSEDSDALYWSVNGSVVCQDEKASGWDGGSLLRCPTGLKVIRAKLDHRGADRRRFPLRPGGALFLIGYKSDAPARTEGATSGDATTIFRRDGAPVVAVQETRVADRWRITRFAICLTGLPDFSDGGLERDDQEVLAIRVQVGHCSVAPVQYDGKTWVVSREDDMGSGGGMPLDFIGIGIPVIAHNLNVGDDPEDDPDPLLQYTDLSGTRLTFVPEGSPDGIETNGICA